MNLLRLLRLSCTFLLIRFHVFDHISKDTLCWPCLVLGPGVLLLQCGDAPRNVDSPENLAAVGRCVWLPVSTSFSVFVGRSVV